MQHGHVQCHPDVTVRGFLHLPPAEAFSVEDGAGLVELLLGGWSRTNADHRTNWRDRLPGKSHVAAIWAGLEFAHVVDADQSPARSCPAARLVRQSSGGGATAS